MKKKYKTPKLTVVSFVVEDGFNSPPISNEALNITLNNNTNEPLERRVFSSNGWAGNDW